MTLGHLLSTIDAKIAGLQQARTVLAGTTDRQRTPIGITCPQEENLDERSGTQTNCGGAAVEMHSTEEGGEDGLGVAPAMDDGKSFDQRTPESQTVIQGILSAPSDRQKPLEQQEFAELRIDDWTDCWQHGFAVTEWRIRWSEIEQEFLWHDEQQEVWRDLQTARNRYERRLRSLKKQGFTRSDMDF